MGETPRRRMRSASVVIGATALAAAALSGCDLSPDYNSDCYEDSSSQYSDEYDCDDDYDSDYYGGSTYNRTGGGSSSYGDSGSYGGSSSTDYGGFGGSGGGVSG